MDVTGLENIPSHGSVVLMMNHMAFIDPVVVTLSIKNRFVVSMAKEETMNTWFSRMVVRTWGNFTIKRGAVDRQALRHSIALLENDNVVLIAPEGTRHPETGLQKAKDGMAYIVHKTNSIIVPTAVVGAVDWAQRLKRFRRAYARITFGQPFRFKISKDERLDKPTRVQMMQEAMYQLALTIPDDFAHKRGIYRNVGRATTQYIDFVNECK